MIQPPCKDCPKKGCGEFHSKCDAYLKFVEENRKEKEIIRKEKKKFFNKEIGK